MVKGIMMMIRRENLKAEGRPPWGGPPGSLTKWALSASYKASREHQSYNSSMLQHIYQKGIPMLNIAKVSVTIIIK